MKVVVLILVRMLSVAVAAKFAEFLSPLRSMSLLGEMRYVLYVDVVVIPNSDSRPLLYK